MRIILAIFLLILLPITIHAELVAHWPLDDGMGSTAREIVGGKHGSLKNFPVNGSQWEEGKVDGALRFDGDNDYVEHFFNLPRNRGTLMHWVKPEGEEAHTIYYQSDYPDGDADYNGGSSGGEVLEITTSLWQGFYCHYYQDGPPDTGELHNCDDRNVNPTGWNHIAATWDRSGDLVMYINCEEVDRTDMSGFNFDNNFPKERFFGRSSTDYETRSLNGLLDDVRVYDHVLEPEEVAEFCDPEAGRHALVATQDNLVQGGTLISHMCEEIIANGGKNEIKDVTLMVNSSIGGGLLDDMEQFFGPNGPCEEIPWVAGSASSAYEPARGWTDAEVALYPGHNLGSAWTQALVGDGFGNVDDTPGVIANGSMTNNVLDDLMTAAAIDIAGPEGYGLEAPRVASGNGGENIRWKIQDVKHEAIVFGGLQTNSRHINNLNNVKTALDRYWGVQDNVVNPIYGGTEQDLLNAISQAATRLNSDTQLLVYISDQGGGSIDFEEAFGGIENIQVKFGTQWQFKIPEGWITGVLGDNFSDPDQLGTPRMYMDVTDCQTCSSWSFYFNGERLVYPTENMTGLIELPISPWNLRSTKNYFQIGRGEDGDSQQQYSDSKPNSDHKIEAADPSLKISHLGFSTGPVNDLGIKHVLKPSQSGAYYDPDRSGEGLFVELLDDQKALVYFFTYNGWNTSQAWMLGQGQLTGESLVVSKMFRPVGGKFGPNFDPDEVEMEEFGMLAFHLPECEDNLEPGSLTISPLDREDFEFMENTNYRQLTRIVDCQTDQGSEKSGLSGSWFDPTHNGEGIILQVLPNGEALVQWFTYDPNGKQVWIQGMGTFNGDTLAVNSLITTSGTSWGSEFDSEAIEAHDWGSLTLEFDGCGTAKLEYEANFGLGSGSMDMQRLTKLMGIDCEE